MQPIIIPVVQPDHNKLEQAYELAEDFNLQFNATEILIPKYFQYDGASIPAMAWQLIGTPFNPQFMRASIVHDWLYHSHQLTQTKSDQLFYELLLASRVNKVKATLMKQAVTRFGGWYWENDKDDLDYIQRLKNLIIEEGKKPEWYGLSKE